MNASKSLNVIQITDTHFREHVDGTIYGIETEALFKKTLQQIKHELQWEESKTDLILVTGDISQDGSDASYQRFHKYLKPLGVPCYYLQGNHDINAPMLKEFGENLLAPCEVAEQDLCSSPWNIILLNSSEEHQVGGHFGKEQLDYLETRLSASRNRPTLVCFHHHPFAIQSAWLDQQKISDSEDFFEIINAHEQVKIAIYGHIHQVHERQLGSTSFFSTPSTCAQFKPELDEFALDDKAPAYRRLRLYEDGRFESKVCRLEW